MIYTELKFNPKPQANTVQPSRTKRATTQLYKQSKEQNQLLNSNDSQVNLNIYEMRMCVYIYKDIHGHKHTTMDILFE